MRRPHFTCFVCSLPLFRQVPSETTAIERQEILVCIPSGPMPSLFVFKIPQDMGTWLVLLFAFLAGVLFTRLSLTRLRGARKLLVTGTFLISYLFCLGGGMFMVIFYYPWSARVSGWYSQQYATLSSVGCSTTTLTASYGRARESAAGLSQLATVAFNLGAVVLIITVLYLVFDQLTREQVRRQ